LENERITNTEFKVYEENQESALMDGHDDQYSCAVPLSQESLYDDDDDDQNEGKQNEFDNDKSPIPVPRSRMRMH
jgi:hypothetical protein